MLHPLTHDGSAEGSRRHVTLTLTDKVLTENLHILNARELLVEVSISTQLIDCFRQFPKKIGVLLLWLKAFGDDILYLLPCNLISSDETLEDLHLLRVAFLPIIEEPGAFLCCRHIREFRYAMMEIKMAKDVVVPSICRQRLILELFEVYELCLVAQQIIKRL